MDVVDAIQYRSLTFAMYADVHVVQRLWTRPDAITLLSEGMGMKFAGNRFHLACGGAVVAWAFGTCVPASVNAIGMRMPMLNFLVDAEPSTYRFGDDEDAGDGSPGLMRSSTKRYMALFNVGGGDKPSCGAGRAMRRLSSTDV